VLPSFSRFFWNCRSLCATRDPHQLLFVFLRKVSFSRLSSTKNCTVRPEFLDFPHPQKNFNARISWWGLLFWLILLFPVTKTLPAQSPVLPPLRPRHAFPAPLRLGQEQKGSLPPSTFIFGVFFATPPPPSSRGKIVVESPVNAPLHFSRFARFKTIRTKSISLHPDEAFFFCGFSLS